MSLQVQSQFEKPLLCICACAAYDIVDISVRVFFESENKCQRSSLLFKRARAMARGWGWGTVECTFENATSGANINSVAPFKSNSIKKALCSPRLCHRSGLGSSNRQPPTTCRRPTQPPPPLHPPTPLLTIRSPITAASSLERLAF